MFRNSRYILIKEKKNKEYPESFHLSLDRDHRSHISHSSCLTRNIVTRIRTLCKENYET